MPLPEGGEGVVRGYKNQGGKSSEKEMYENMRDKSNKSGETSQQNSGETAHHSGVTHSEHTPKHHGGDTSQDEGNTRLKLTYTYKNKENRDVVERHTYTKVPENGHYLIVRRPIVECPMCYTETCLLNYTVNTVTFVVTYVCICCNLTTYVVPNHPSVPGPRVEIVKEGIKGKVSDQMRPLPEQVGSLDKQTKEALLKGESLGFCGFVKVRDKLQGVWRTDTV